MGEVEIKQFDASVQVHAEIILYGDAASSGLAVDVARNIEEHWNEPRAEIRISGKWYNVRFHVTGTYAPDLIHHDVYENTDPRKNYFRIEEYAHGNISFVDGINSNTGYFKLDNLLNNSTTAAHEFGHTIGLDHPEQLDITGEGVPGIMYPRGTITDPAFQYDPNARPLAPGGTMNPFTRKVLISDINDLKISFLPFDKNGKAVLGGFTSIWHDRHLPLS